MTRRTFAFWLSFGLFGLAERLRVYGLDELAAAIIRRTDAVKYPVHWRAADNGYWQWYERETFIDGQWKLSGITTPIGRSSGEYAEKNPGYLDENLVPPEMRSGGARAVVELKSELAEAFEKRHATSRRQARHGRPPSKWLRNLHADEIRIWLRTIDVPEADVSGMTFWEHLTRDHSFEPANLEGLTEAEQAKLHAAAHAGY
jgi:hypothetical protein